MIAETEIMQRHEYWMEMAYQQAISAKDNAEVPVGAILVSADDRELSRQFNRKEMNYNVAGHAEILCLQDASEKMKNWRLSDCTLYVTLEPCLMCLSALQQARVKKVVFGAYDLKGGALSLGYPIYKDKKMNHQLEIVGGILHFKCSKILSDFFKSRRETYIAK